MKRKLMIIMLLGSTWARMQAQQLIPAAMQESQCIIVPISQAAISSCNNPGSSDSRNGGIFTPKGDLRVLIVFAGFDNRGPQNEKIGDQQVFLWNAKDSIDNSKPVATNVPVYVDPITGAMPSQMFQDISEFSLYCTPTSNNKSLSRYYYDMSRGKFRIMGNVFSDVNGKPIRVNVTAQSNIGSIGAYSSAVINEMKLINPNFDFSPFDNRTNRPEYNCDNSTSSPDSKLDYVIFIYRWSNDWPIKLPGNPEGGVYSNVSVGSINFNGYNFTRDGYTLSEGNGGGIGSFVHELGHELFDGPHYLGANNAMGDRLYINQSGWGMVVMPMSDGCWAGQRIPPVD